MKTRLTALLVPIVCCAGAAFAADRPLHFVVVPKVSNHVFFKQAELGCKKAGEQIPGVECEYLGPSKLDSLEQVRLLEDLLIRGVDGIAVAPVDSASLGRFLERRGRLSVPVVTFDSDLLPEQRRFRQVYIGTNNYEIGAQMARKLREFKPRGGKICLFSGQAGEANLNERMRGLRETLAGVTDSKGMGKPLQGENGWSEVPGCPLFHNGDFSVAVRQLDDIMIKHPAIDALSPVGGWPQLLPAAYRTFAVKHADRITTKQTVIVIADTLPDQMRLLREGWSHANIGQRPFEMGYQSVRILKELKEGRQVPEYSFTGLDICTQETVSSCQSSPSN